MTLLTPSKKVPLEGHFGGRLKRNRCGHAPISRPMARCCTIAAMSWHKNSHLQALRRWLGTLVLAGLPSVASAATAGRPDTAQLLAAVCVGALIVLVAVAIAQRRRNPAPPAPMAAHAAPRAPDATASRINELQAMLNGREHELAERTRELAGRLRELDNAGRELDSFAHRCRTICARRCAWSTGSPTSCWRTTASGKPLDDLGREHLRRIVAAGQRMNSMIDTLLTLSRMTSREIDSESVDLSHDRPRTGGRIARAGSEPARTSISCSPTG